ncbi:MAG: 50S ribosomal protein L24e [Candidatus Nezhaarchaeota archaeon]|nr:50S ribosomal protein L24e [Candidatus Nezhaarchaeota archaeon]
MIRVAKCSFCGSEIAPGEGIMFIRRDGTALHFCSSKCRKNMLKLGRKPAKLKWARGSGKPAKAEAKS